MTENVTKKTVRPTQATSPACCDSVLLSTCCAQESKPQCCGAEKAPVVCGCDESMRKTL